MGALRRTSRPEPASRRPRPLRCRRAHEQRQWIRHQHRHALRRGKDDSGCVCRVKETPMPDTHFVKVADLKDVPEGTPKAVKVEGRSIALFQHQGNVYATDNQCPHMGYPLTRGRVRNGVLTCDWHGWSYDMRGGGCFTV